MIRGRLRIREPLFSYASFFARVTSFVFFCRKNCLSTTFRNSSIKLLFFKGQFRSSHWVLWFERVAYMTGELMTNTAFHSFQLRGRIENKLCRKGT